MHSTLLEALAANLAAQGKSHPNHESPPSVVLWLDEDGQWEPLLPLLRARMPGLFTFGPYVPETRQGPAIWLRCVLERTLEGITWPKASVPIFYLPRIKRQDLRGVETSPAELLPLVELQYRGLTWTQRNGKDWTIEAFLMGQDLNLSLDKQTRQALRDYLANLAVYPLNALRGKTITVTDLDRFMLEDAPRAVLQWLNDPKGAKAEWDANRWKAFCSRCANELGFSPEKEGERIAAERLGLRQGPWAPIWERFTETPALYPGIPAQLERAQPASFDHFEDHSAWPDFNAIQEDMLREGLAGLPKRHAQELDETFASLAKAHLPRRKWVWASLGRSSLVFALEHLVAMRTEISKGLPGGASKDLALAYFESGYRVDAAAVEGAACVQTEADTRAVHAALKVLYVPWLEAQTLRFQQHILSEKAVTHLAPLQAKVEAAPGQALLFVDGLRMDLAQRAAVLAEGRGWDVQRKFRMSPFPTVTGTAKANVLPGADQLVGDKAEPDFCPVQKESGQKPSGQKATTERLCKWMTEAGYQVFSREEVQAPETAKSKGYLECGNLDHDGHHVGMRLVYQCQREVEGIVTLIQNLLDAGWRSVRVVTDHGWLLVPDALPKADLPKFLSETRWSRCALVKDTGACDHPRLPWYWNPAVDVVYPKGIQSFAAGNQYSHGGISLQECVIPDFTFTNGGNPEAASPVIVEATWRRLSMRLRVEKGSGCFAELRQKLGDAGSAACERKAVDEDGKVNLIVENEDMEGLSVFIVITDGSGKLLTKAQTVVGG
ncbi:MAG: BREX-1 system phosphatase PglZ type B [Fibrobacterota bacterium]|nr:BREX-1 system phosphatase PglZ type B [Fibrobacterota bacterium]